MSLFGVVIFGCLGFMFILDECEFFKEYNFFGFILFVWNIDSGD